MARIPVAILAGGRGTRLRPALGDRPKVVALVAGRPFLCFVLDELERSGFRDVVLCTGHGADEVEAALGAAHGALRLRYSRESEPLGTAGALRSALPLLEGEAVMAMNGDSFCDADLAAAWTFHRERGSEATLVLTWVADAARYGRVEIDREGVVQGFAEKQPGATPGWINAGIYLLARSQLAALPASRPLSLEREVLPEWIGHGLHGFRTRGRFVDIGTPQSYADASRFFATGRPGADP
jgi:NDP-sugar pyrophosphorylase family protein